MVKVLESLVEKIPLQEISKMEKDFELLRAQQEITGEGCYSTSTGCYSSNCYSVSGCINCYTTD